MKPQKNPHPTLSVIKAPMGFIAGATYPFKALALLSKTPQLLGYVAIPIFLNFVIGIALYIKLLSPGFESIDSLVISFSDQLNTWILTLPTWLSFLAAIDTLLSWLLRGVLVITLLLGIGFIFVQFGVILGSPFYGLLSEQLEKLQIGQLPQGEPLNPLGIFRDIGRAILFELKKLLILIGFGVPLLLLNFVPIAGSLLATIGGIILMGTIACLDFLDSPLERRRLPFREKLAIIRRSLPASASFGMVCFFLVSVPLCNLLAIPVCVTAGTLFFCERIWPIYFAQTPKSEIELP